MSPLGAVLQVAKVVYHPQETPGGCDETHREDWKEPPGRDLALCVWLEARKMCMQGGYEVVDPSNDQRKRKLTEAPGRSLGIDS